MRVDRPHTVPRDLGNYNLQSRQGTSEFTYFHPEPSAPRREQMVQSPLPSIRSIGSMESVYNHSLAPIVHEARPSFIQKIFLTIKRAINPIIDFFINIMSKLSNIFFPQQRNSIENQNSEPVYNVGQYLPQSHFFIPNTQNDRAIVESMQQIEADRALAENIQQIEADRALAERMQQEQDEENHALNASQNIIQEHGEAPVEEVIRRYGTNVFDPPPTNINDFLSYHQQRQVDIEIQAASIDQTELLNNLRPHCDEVTAIEKGEIVINTDQGNNKFNLQINLVDTTTLENIFEREEVEKKFIFIARREKETLILNPFAIDSFNNILHNQGLNNPTDRLPIVLNNDSRPEDIYPENFSVILSKRELKRLIAHH